MSERGKKSERSKSSKREKGRKEGKKVQTRDSVSEDTRLREILRSLPEHGRQAVKALQELQEEEGGEGEERRGKKFRHETRDLRHEV